MNILLADCDKEWACNLKKFFNQNNIHATIAMTGKDFQLNLYRSKFNAALLDVRIKQHSAVEVIRYVKLNHPEVKLILTQENNDDLSDIGVSENFLKKVGIKKIYKKPIDKSVLLSQIIGTSNFSICHDIKDVVKNHEKMTLNESDNLFTKVHHSNFYSDEHLVLDYYIRISPDKYIKFFHKGTKLTANDKEKLVGELKVMYLYFKNSDRAIYINHMNTVLENLVTEKPARVVGMFHDVVNKIIDDVEKCGICIENISEAKRICESIYKNLQYESCNRGLLIELENLDLSSHTHQFLTCLFSVMITKKLDWSTPRTIEFVSMASMFVKIGKLKLGSEISSTPLDELSKENRIIYHQYPTLGSEILEKYSFSGKRCILMNKFKRSQIKLLF